MVILIKIIITYKTKIEIKENEYTFVKFLKDEKYLIDED